MTTNDALACRLANWTVGLTPEAIPEETRHAARRSIVDTVAVAIGGSTVELAAGLRAHAAAEYPGSDCTLLGTDETASAVGAALVNGHASHVLDFDDTSYAGIIHGSTVMLPALLSVAEREKSSGLAFETAFVAASEVAYGVGLTLSKSHYMRGWWASGTCGGIGAAAGAAKLLQLDDVQTANAIGMAAVNAFGMIGVAGTASKPLLAGRAASMATEVAYLAKTGFNAPVAAFEDRRGFLALMNGGEQHAIGLAELGKTWRLVDPGVLFKRYPVCSAAQAAGEMTERLISDNELGFDDIAEVQCDVTELVDISLVYDRPKSPEEAQFSMPFALGAIIADGRLGPEHLDPERMRDPRLVAAMEKVVKRRSDDVDTPEMRERYPEGARVTIKTTAGAEHSGYLGAPTGMPENPLSDEALGQKFHDCAKLAAWSQDRSDAVLAGLWSLKSADDINRIFKGSVS